MRKPKLTLLSRSTLALLIGSGSGAMAQSTPPAEADTIVVTGTRQANRTLTDSMSPIQVMNQEALQHTGKAGLQESLANVLPSLTLPSQAGGNLTSIVRIATLRGLNPDHVLVLVNGKRFHPTSIVNVAGSVAIGSQGVDLNMIPSAAIQRIEVLTDGAAAQYGSDAIAGVINVILKSSTSAGSAMVQAGEYFEGDGQNQLYTLNSGFALGGDGMLNLSAGVTNQRLTNRAIDATISPRYYTGDPRNSLPAGIVYKGYGIPESQSQAVSFNLSKPITDAVSLYGFGTATRANGKNWVGYRAANNNNNVVAIYPDGFEPRIIVRQLDFAATGGLKGSNFGGWNWDLSLVHGKNRAETYLTDSVNPTYGLLSPTSFYDGAFTAAETTANADFSREFDTGIFATPLNVALGAEARKDSYGIEAGEVASWANGGQPQLTGPNAGKFVTLAGAQAFAGFRPVDALDASRKSAGLYVDLATQIRKGWDVGLAARTEHYSDFGNNTSGKLSTRYQFVPAFAMRGAISNGFRAPSLGQQYYSAGATAQYKGADYTIANLPVQSAAAKLIGAQALKPEKSTNLSLGVVLKPLPGATVTADAYLIELKDRIVQSAQIGLSPAGVLDPALATLLKSQGINGIDAARYFLNGVNTRTSGLDLVATYRLSLAAYGAIDWSLAGNFTRTKIASVAAAASQTVYGTQIFNQVSQDQLTMTTPNNKFMLSADWAMGPWRAFARETRYGSFVTPSTVAGGYSAQGPKWITDVELSYSYSPRVVLSVGAQNLFNTYPSATNAANFSAASFNGAQIYNSASPFGLSGGNYYGRLSVSWL